MARKIRLVRDSRQVQYIFIKHVRVFFIPDNLLRDIRDISPNSVLLSLFDRRGFDIDHY